MNTSLLQQKLNLPDMQTQWASQLNPIIQNPTINTNLIQNQTLKIGNNIINHGLGRNLRGWYITRIRNAASTIYDTQDANPSPQLTLTLNSSAAVVVDLVVF